MNRRGFLGWLGTLVGVLGFCKSKGLAKPVVAQQPFLDPWVVKEEIKKTLQPYGKYLKSQVDISCYYKEWSSRINKKGLPYQTLDLTLAISLSDKTPSGALAEIRNKLLQPRREVVGIPGYQILPKQVTITVGLLYIFWQGKVVPLDI